MNKAFIGLYDKAVTLRIGESVPGLAEDLKVTMERFLEYAQSTIQDSETEEDRTAPNISARRFECEDGCPADEIKSSLDSIKVAEGPDLSQQHEMGLVVAASLGFDLTYPVDATTDVRNVQSVEMDKTQDIQMSNMDVSDWIPVERQQQSQTKVPKSIAFDQSLSPSFSKSLPIPSSYSFQERSFARRLLRTALESAYRVMTSPNSPKEEIERFCRSTFTWSNRYCCILKIEELLSKNDRESLENWRAPQLHIGDAGLHYERIGFDVGSPPPVGWDAKAPIGPNRPIEPETPVDNSLSTDEIARLLGFDGEWFDSNDVEQYLRSKGIFLDSRSSFVEVDDIFSIEPPLEDNLPSVGSPTESSRYSSGGPSPRIADLSFLDGPVSLEDQFPWNEETLISPIFQGVDLGSLMNVSDPEDAKLPSNSHTFDPEALPNSPSPIDTHNKKYIDVEKFVSGICSNVPRP